MPVAESSGASLMEIKKMEQLFADIWVPVIDRLSITTMSSSAATPLEVGSPYIRLTSQPARGSEPEEVSQEKRRVSQLQQAVKKDPDLVGKFEISEALRWTDTPLYGQLFRPGIK